MKRTILAVAFAAFAAPLAAMTPSQLEQQYGVDADNVTVSQLAQIKAAVESADSPTEVDYRIRAILN